MRHAMGECCVLAGHDTRDSKGIALYRCVVCDKPSADRGLVGINEIRVSFCKEHFAEYQKDCAGCAHAEKCVANVLESA